MQQEAAAPRSVCAAALDAVRKPFRSPLAGFRWLFLLLNLFTIVCLMLPLVLLGPSSWAMRPAALAALLWLALSWAYAYHRGGFPLWADLPEGLALWLVAGNVGLPLNALALIYPAIYYRSIYAGRARLVVVVVVYLAALFAAVPFAAYSHAPDILTQPFLMELPGVPVTAAVVYLLAAVLRKYEQARTHEQAMRGELEAALAEKVASEEQYRALVDNANDLVFSHDRAGNITAVNRAAETLLDYSREELLTMRVQDLLMPEPRALARETLTRERMGEALPRWPVEVRHRNGQRKTLELSLRSIMRDGQLVGTQGVARDVTERLRMERELRESEERYRTVVENVPIGLYRVTADGRVLVANAALLRMLGYDSADAFERALPDLRRRFAYVGDHALQAERLGDEGAALGIGVPWERPDGGQAYLRNAVWVSRAADGTAQYYEGAVEDVTEQHNLEAQLRQTERLAAVGELAAGVAHEVNNPLAVIAMRAELNLAGHRDPQLHEDLTVIRQQAQRAGDIVRSLLRFARQREPSLAPVDLVAVVQEALSLQADRLARHGIAVAHDTPVPRLVTGDRDQLLQVLVNLVGNAVDAMRPQGSGTLAVRLAEASGTVTLELQDSGPGVPEELQTRIFDPFFTTKPVGEGTGLGLSLCHRIVVDHGGSLSATNAPAGGACFRMTLTAVRTDAAMERPARDTVAIVESDALAASLLAEAVQLVGWRTERVEDVSAAWDAAENYAAVLASPTLPAALVRQLKDRWPGARLIATASPQQTAPLWDAVLSPSYTLADLDLALTGTPTTLPQEQLPCA